MDINNNCVIGLCVYNNERGLPSVLSNIVKISQSKLFDKITVVAFYDASADKSYSILESFKNQHSKSGPGFSHELIETVIISNHKKEIRMSFGNASRVIDKSRTMRIANARNEILNYMRFAHKRGQVNKYFIMMDSNEYACVGQINIDTLRSAIQRSDEWDSISFDREAGYYDYWALSFDPHIYSFYHVENRNETLNNMVASFATKLKNAIKEPIIKKTNTIISHETTRVREEGEEKFDITNTKLIDNLTQVRNLDDNANEYAKEMSLVC